MKKHIKNNGFTLVELAIVMTIIGLLIGGILKGQELIENARAKALWRDYNGITAAALTFRDKYGQLPGDMSTATTRLTGCTAPCVNGDSNSRIGFSTLWQVRYRQAGFVAPPEVETSMFFKHLALTELIKGVDPTADPTEYAWGVTHPAAPFNGGFSITYSRTYQNDRSAHFLRFTKGLNPDPGDPMLLGSTSGESISPHQAWKIDKMFDDGMPNTGVVLADDFVVGINGCEFTYDYQATDERCYMMFDLKI